MEERRKVHVQGHELDDVKTRLTRIEQQGIDSHINTKIMENSFDNHREQNEKDFQHIDECIHKHESESRGRDDTVSKQIERMSEDILELKKFMWKAGGSLLVLVPVINYLLGRYL